MFQTETESQWYVYWTAALHRAGVGELSVQAEQGRVVDGGRMACGR